VAEKVLNLPIKKKEHKVNFGIDETILLLLYAFILIGSSRNMRIMRFISLSAGFIFLGFYLNSSISIGNISSILLGYFPSFTKNPLWWLLVPGIILMTFLTRKNLYFSWLCPFGAMQELTARAGFFHIHLSKKLIKYAGYVSYILTWIALMIIFVTANPALGAYEPFATFFGLEGLGIQWFILPIVILGSFALPRFWCRFFCPVRVIMEIIIRARLGFDKITKGIKIWITKRIS
jgi:polyferredoxin